MEHADPKKRRRALVAFWDSPNLCYLRRCVPDPWSVGSVALLRQANRGDKASLAARSRRSCEVNTMPHLKKGLPSAAEQCKIRVLIGVAEDG